MECAVNNTSTVGQCNEGVDVWTRYVPEALKTGSLKPAPAPIVVGKGLEKISEAIEVGKKGISAGKLVVEL